MEASAECTLLLICATPEGKKELLVDIKRRGLEIAPDLAISDGALGWGSSTLRTAAGRPRGGPR
jgi:putative transposase